MIDVPVRVKDALKSGDYRKEYIIGVDITGWHFVQERTAILDQYGAYRIDDPSLWSLFSAGDTVRLVYPASGSGMYVDLYPDMGAAEEYQGIAADNAVYFEFVLSEPISRGHLIIFNHTLTQTQTIQFYKYREGYDNLDNSKLVAESVKFDERMCSDTELKFGLCEGTSVEFQYFDFPNIRGQHISIELDVEYKDENGNLSWHTIPMGQYDVDECSRQASTGIIKAVAYNKLKSGYLDQDASARVTEIIQGTGVGMASVADIIETLLDDYAIPTTTYEEKNGHISNFHTSYTCQSGVRIYKVDGFPYNPPQSPVINEDIIGKYFGIYTIDFYYIPDGETGIQTDDTYYYDIDYSAIWNIISNRYTTAWQSVDSTEAFEINNPYSVFEDGSIQPYPTIEESLYVGNISVDGGQTIIYLRDHNTGRGNTPLFTGYYPKFTIAAMVECDFLYDSDYSPNTGAIISKITEKAGELISALQNVKLARIYKYNGSPINSRNITVNDIKQGVTLRDLQSASFEINCQYGKLDRVTDLFAGIELNEGALYPRDNLYPANDLLPMGTAESGYPAMYSKLWADEGNVRTFRYLIITYKSTEVVDGQTQEVEKKLQRTVNANGTDNYNMSDNWLFRNLIWTDAQVGAYADAMVEKMRNISWFPFEMWCVGLPYIEAGDIIEIAMKNGTYPSPVLRRNLNGIQNLQDEMINGTLDIF